MVLQNKSVAPPHASAGMGEAKEAALMSVPKKISDSTSEAELEEEAKEIVKSELVGVLGEDFSSLQDEEQEYAEDIDLARFISKQRLMISSGYTAIIGASNGDFDQNDLEGNRLCKDVSHIKMLPDPNGLTDLLNEGLRQAAQEAYALKDLEARFRQATLGGFSLSPLCEDHGVATDVDEFLREFDQPVAQHTTMNETEGHDRRPIQSKNEGFLDEVLFDPSASFGTRQAKSVKLWNVSKQY